jgi:hypothetical protein
MSKHTVFTCDRCGREKNGVDLPDSWGNVNGRDLCTECVRELREWLLEKKKD